MGYTTTLLLGRCLEPLMILNDGPKAPVVFLGLLEAGVLYDVFQVIRWQRKADCWQDGFSAQIPEVFEGLAGCAVWIVPSFCVSCHRSLVGKELTMLLRAYSQVDILTP